MEKMLLKTAMYVMGVFVLLQVIKTFLRIRGLEVDRGYLGALLFHGQKNPPGLSYMIFYGGSGLFMLYVLAVMIRRRVLSAFIDFLRMIGRNSLFVFILQYFFLISLNVLLRPCWTPLWPLLFLSESLMVVLLTWFWDSKGYNRLLTILHPGVWKEVVFIRKRK